MNTQKAYLSHFYASQTIWMTIKGKRKPVSVITQTNASKGDDVPKDHHTRLERHFTDGGTATRNTQCLTVRQWMPGNLSIYSRFLTASKLLSGTLWDVTCFFHIPLTSCTFAVRYAVISHWCQHSLQTFTHRLNDAASYILASQLNRPFIMPSIW